MRYEELFYSYQLSYLSNPVLTTVLKVELRTATADGEDCRYVG